MRVPAFAQGGRRWYGPKIEGAGEDGLFPLALDSIKVVLAQAKQTEVALQNVAVGDAGAHWEGWGHEGVEVDALELLANQCQTGLLAQVVGKLFEKEFGHVGFTRRVKSR